jgi:serine/threonine protein kinase
MSSNDNSIIGKTIGQFTILEEIGRGGMATVYSAMQTSMNRKVAIKVLPPHFLHDPGFLDRFVREVEVISHLEHPHILPIYDYGQVDNVPFIAMRYLGGGSMAQMIRRGVLGLDEIEKPFTQVCDALDYAHQQSIIHRDLKPGNIMLDETGNAYLSDFGIARVMGSNLTGSAIIGTPAYMSPEQAHGLSIDGRSDIYAMGVVLFELITGREPFQAETPMGLLLMHINEPLPSVSEFREDVPYLIQAVVDKATAKNPDERFSSAGEMARAYKAALRGEDWRGQTGSRTKPKVDVQATLPPRGFLNEGGTLIPGTDSIPSGGQSSTQQGSTLPGQPGTNPTGTMGSTQTLNPIQRPGFTWVAALAIVAVLVIGGVALASQLMPSPPVQPLNPVPTPFRSAVTVTEADTYTISIPQRWMPISSDYIDESDATRLVHIWQSEDSSAFATLAIADDMSQEAYVERYYASQGHLAFIDEASAPNGTIRRSYRFTEASGGFGPGQMDVFFQQQNNQLIVLELYTADSVASDSTTLTTLQLVLDSLRITAPAQAG